MSHTQLSFHSAGREKVLAGATKLAEAGVLLLSEGTLTEVPDKKAPEPAEALAE